VNVVAVPQTPEDLEEIEAQRRKETRHFWIRMGLLSLGLLIAVGFVAASIYYNLTGSAQRDQIKALQASSDCKSIIVAREASAFDDLLIAIANKDPNVDAAVDALRKARDDRLNIVEVCKP
jgi:hypothetical protein